MLWPGMALAVAASIAAATCSASDSCPVHPNPFSWQELSFHQTDVEVLSQQIAVELVPMPNITFTSVNGTTVALIDGEEGSAKEVGAGGRDLLSCHAQLQCKLIGLLVA